MANIFWRKELAGWRPALTLGLAAMSAQGVFILAGVFGSYWLGLDPAPFLAAATACLALQMLAALRYAPQSEDRSTPRSADGYFSTSGGKSWSAPNRAWFNEQLEHVVAQARRFDRRAAVYAVEIEGAKEIAGKLGGEIGEKLIETALQRLIACARAEDVVGRLGDDKFGVILHAAPSAASLTQSADRIAENLSTPYVVLGHRLTVGAKVGIGLMIDRSDEAAIVAERADTALYHAKTQTFPRYCVYEDWIGSNRREQAQLARDLSTAISARRLSVAYQPVVDPSGDTVVGVEALCRWRHDDLGDVPPVKFIPIAETSGEINALGEQVLRQACRDARNWEKISVAVNVSSHQFRGSGFVELVQSVLDDSGLDPRRLELELTESVLVSEIDDAVAKINRLKEIGVRLALDDFGTGYSSLNYLLALPFDKLKIDRSFVLKSESGASGAAVVHSIVSLGRALGLHVTAEGVDSADQHQFLRIAGVHSFQGYRFGRPMMAREISERLATQQKNFHTEGAAPCCTGGRLAR